MPANIVLIGMDIFLEWVGSTVFMSRREATEVFSEWAEKGKDKGMENGHAASVHAMLKLAGIPRSETYSAVDVGCGNGWVCRLLAQDESSTRVVGVDGSEAMIAKAKTIDSDGDYRVTVLPDWEPSEKFDIVHSMEFLYYLHDPQAMLKKLHDNWMNSGGMLVAGVDHYLENKDSLTWPEALNVHMTTLSMEEWKTAMIEAGFTDVELHQVAAKDSFIGTLVMCGNKA